MLTNKIFYILYIFLLSPSTFATQILSNSESKNLCLVHFEKGKSLGCPEKELSDEAEYLPEFEEIYEKIAADNLLGDEFIIGSSKFFVEAVNLLLITLITKGILSHIFPQQDNQLAVGVGIGASFVSFSNLITNRIESFASNYKNRFAQYMVYPLLKWPMQSVFYYTGAPVWPFAESSTIVWKPLEMLEARKLKFQSLKNELPKDFQDAVSERIQHLEKIFKTEQFEKTVEDKFTVIHQARNTNLKKFEIIDRILNFPLKSKKLNKESYGPKLDQLLSSYSPEIQNGIKNLVSSIDAEACVSDKTFCKNSRGIYYFLGASGTGKTFLIRELGKVLDLPVIVIKLNAKQDEFALVGAPNEVYETDWKSVGTLTSALTSLSESKRYNNAIIFIDEVDKVLNTRTSGVTYGGDFPTKGISSRPLSTFLLDLLDRVPKPLRLHSLGIHADMSKFTFVLAGNAPIVGTSNEFMQRMHTLDFGSFELDKRIEIACTHFGRLQAKNSESNYDVDTLLQIIHTDDDKNIGLRALLTTVDNYASHLDKIKTFDLSLEQHSFDWKSILDTNSRSASDIVSELALLKKNLKKKRESFSKDAYNHPLFITVENEIQKFEEKEFLKTFFSTEDAKKGMKLIKRIQDILKLPVGLKDLSLDIQMIPKLNKILSLYPDSVQKNLMEVLQTHIQNSKGGYEENEDVTKSVQYFLGEPGTLKTSLVKEIAEIMGLPIIELSLDSTSSTSSYSSYSSSYESTDSHYPPLTSSFLASNGKNNYYENAIILIDEIDRSLNGNSALISKIMKMIDASPFRKEFELPKMESQSGSEIKIDLSRFLFILIGNEKVQDVKGKSNLSAFNRRVNVIKFEGFSYQNKLDVAYSMFSRASKSKLEGDQQEHLEFVKNITDSFHQDIQSDGFGALEKVIKQYVSKCKRSSDCKTVRESFDYKTLLRTLYSDDKAEKANQELR